MRSAGTAFAVTLPSAPPPAFPMPVLPGDLVAGKYEVEWAIGAGGMGIVVAAMHRVLGQRVAIKFPSAEIRGSTEGRERMLREARACVRLRSEHTVRVLDVGTLEDGAPFIVMEYLLGRSLADRLREEGPLPAAEAVDTVRQACAALDEAHASGIIHRDLKPSNLIETRRFDGSRLVKVVDFGIAKGPSLASGGDDLTTTRGVMGSPAYMAPEQLRSTRDVDARADLWALGVTLHELLTGELGPRADGTLRVQPVALERIIRRCLEHDPSRRFARARDLGEALAPFGNVGAGGNPAGRKRSVAWWIPAVALASAALAGTATWAVHSRAPAAASPAAVALSPAVPTAPTASAPPLSSAPEASPAPAPAPLASSTASTSKPLARILAPARPTPPAPPAPPPSATAVDPHGLSDRK